MCNNHEKRDRMLVVLKVDSNFQISQRNKIYLLIEFSEIGLILSKKCTEL